MQNKWLPANSWSSDNWLLIQLMNNQLPNTLALNTWVPIWLTNTWLLTQPLFRYALFLRHLKLCTIIKEMCIQTLCTIIAACIIIQTLCTVMKKCTIIWALCTFITLHYWISITLQEFNCVIGINEMSEFKLHTSKFILHQIHLMLYFFFFHLNSHQVCIHVNSKLMSSPNSQKVWIHVKYKIM